MISTTPPIYRSLGKIDHDHQVDYIDSLKKANKHIKYRMLLINQNRPKIL